MGMSVPRIGAGDMAMDGTGTAGDKPPMCRVAGCHTEAAFWLYRPTGGWRPLCERHVVHLHPSLELHAWLAAGYARPVERGRPTGPPPAPRGGRETAFREAIDEAME